MNRSALLATLAFGIAQDVVFGLIFLSFMNYYLLDVVGASSAAPGYTLALYGGTKLIVHPLAGRLLDLTWPRLVCVLGIGIQAFALFLLIGSDSVVVFYVAASLLGAGSATMWPLVYALMAGTQPADVRPRVGAILATTGYLATGAGFGLGVLLAELEANRAAFLAALVILGIPALSIATRLFPHRARTEHEESPGAERTRTVTALVLFSLVIFIDYSALSSLAGLYGPYIRRTLDLTLLRAAIMLAPAGLAALGSLLAVSRWSRTRRRFLEMAVLYVGATAGAAILASTTNQWVAATAAVPLAAGIGGIGPLVAATVLDVGGGSGRGVIIGALMSVEGLGSVLGPGGVALVVDIFGPRGGFTAITTMFAVLIVLTLYAYTFQHRARREAVA